LSEAFRSEICHEMSASEVLANKLESETERPAHRAPPPPPISTQSEPPSPIEIIPTPYEVDTISTFTELSNELTKDAEDKCPLLL
jgi:hypothetical protein